MKNTQAAIQVMQILESFGNFLLGRKVPPWIRDKAEQDKRIRGSWQYILWRNAILRRDNYTCIECGEDRRSLIEADHIKPYSLFPELRFAIDNGRTLCNNCHRKTETYGGRVKKWKR